MTPAEVITEIVHLGGKIWTEGERLKFRDAPARLVPAIREHKTALLALLKEQTNQRSTPPANVAPEPDMTPQSAPATVSCGQCVRLQPGTTKMGIGVCLATANGLPPAGRNGDYKAAYPNAPRSCPEYRGAQS